MPTVSAREGRCSVSRGKIIPARGNSQLFISQRVHVIELVGLTKLNFVVMSHCHAATHQDRTLEWKTAFGKRKLLSAGDSFTTLSACDDSGHIVGIHNGEERSHRMEVS